MANWNLSVDIRGHGNDLAQSLKSSAKHARTLANAARAAKTEVRELGQASQTAGRHVRTLGSEARTAGRRLNALGDGAQRVARHLNRYGDAARTANRNVNRLGDDSRTAGRQLARMSGQINSAVRDLLRLADAARRADARLGRVGDSGIRGMRRYREETGRAHSALKSMAGLAAAGGLTLGAAEVVKEGNEYQQAMNAFGATTGATQMQMQRAAATANQLGNDLRLPGATASDAAEGMVELAKAGFRTDQAISATRASLVLASAAQVNAADSAKYLGDMMDQFGMGADQASTAADTLAATANAASGDIIDIYYAMKYAGPVAHGLGVTMQETAAAVGMLGKAGILGQTAGTTLRGMMANLAAPTPQMIEGLKAMNIEAWDAQGNFKGLRYVIDGLSKAQHHMTQQDFAAAVKKSMGKPAMSGAIALAHQGVDSFDALMAAVTDTGAASDIAAAKGKGLAGAMLQLKTQARQTGLTIYQGMAPGLEFLTRGVTSGLSRATPAIEHFFDYFNDAATLFGPDLAAAARQEFSGIADAAKDMAAPFKDLGGEAVADFLHLVLTAGKLAIQVLQNLADGVEPVVGAFGDLSGESGTVASTLDLVVTALDLAATAAGALSGVLIPIGHVVGGLVSAFAGLPGPIQQFVLAALLVRRIQPGMAGLATTVSGRVTGAFRSLNDQMNVQRSLAAASGASLSRYGAAFAVLQARVPVVGRMGDAFRTASAQGSGFAGTLRGITAAAGTGLRGAMGGLMGATGGPWGLALTGLTVGLGMLASSQQAAAAKAAEHKANIDGLTTAMRQSNGVIDETVRQQAAQSIQNTKVANTSQSLMDIMGKVGYTLSDVTDSYLGQGESVDQLADKLEALSKQKMEEANQNAHGFGIFDKRSDEAKQTEKQAEAYQYAAKALRSMSGDASEAAKNAKSLDAATKGTGDGASAYDRLKGAVSALADKTADADTRTRALKDALDLLSGGSVSLQAAQARVNEAITNANESLADGVDKANGWGKALVNANGTLNTTTRNGQSLFNTLTSLADGSASAATAAYDFAQSQGKDVPTSMKAAQTEMSKAREAAVKLGTEYGLSKTQAEGVADAMGLIPGQVSILLSTKGVDTTLAELIAVQAEFQQWPDKLTIKVDALGEGAKKNLEELGYQIKLIPGTREYKITAPTKAARDQLGLLIAQMAKVPDSQSVHMDAKTAVAIQGIQAVQAEVRKTPKATSVKVSTLNAQAIAALEAVGLKTRQLKDGRTEVYTSNGQSISAIGAVAAAMNRLDGTTASTTITTNKVTKFSTVGSKSAVAPAHRDYAHGGVVDYYAHGGTRPGQVSFFANGSADPGDRRNQHTAQIVPAGSWRVFGEDETQGEGYVPFRASARPRSRAITEEIVKRLGGDPSGIQWNANGNVTDWRYDPNTGTLYSASDAGQAGHKTKKVKTKVKGKWQTKEVEYFDITAVEKKLRSAAKATTAWNKDLERVADRVGGDVADALAAMGEDGMKLAHKMATGSTKYINDMAKALKNLQATAKASLTDYTRQLGKANTLNKTFSDNLAKLAAQGFGDLASQLASQNDEAAQQLAAAAVKDKNKAKSANAQAKTANNALTADQVTELVQIIAAITTKSTGIHDVAAKTSLGEDEIITVATKAKAQISKSLGSRATKFLADLTRANKHLSYADGGIRAGMYATRGGIVRFAEPETHGEAYLPLSASKRRTALPVLNDVAHRFGYGLTDARSTRPVVVIRDGDTTHVSVTAVRTGATASDIGAQVGRSVRRARRGGVAARAA
ncbi:phage tail tape measure protein [Streptomyces pseudovenezuelae]|uniref:phage tail tape measure protein n=1 Tax=Streptomyces pseudovenezuelae TaxID=67350 RepID=UPI002E823C1A|nr:phage tail tape measure protein [Streptomyces pseudovenezuelae]WUA94440.1 phage tail tape measure protein [Streptomyces pseudovenezuelae]